MRTAGAVGDRLAFRLFLDPRCKPELALVKGVGGVVVADRYDSLQHPIRMPQLERARETFGRRVYSCVPSPEADPMSSPRPSPGATTTSPAARAAAVVAELRTLGSGAGRAGMARFGINVDDAFGVSMTAMRLLERRHRRDHNLAAALWASGIHEARILAALIDDPKAVTPAQMDAWAADFHSWDLCDQACMKLFARTPYVVEKVAQWAADEREFVRRAAFALIASYAVAAKSTPDSAFLVFLPLIEAHATDPRNFVRKAVNWALRQTAKRSFALHAPALALAERLAASSDKTARWIGKDAVKELTDPKQLERLKAKGEPGL